MNSFKNDHKSLRFLHFMKKRFKSVSLCLDAIFLLHINKQHAFQNFETGFIWIENTPFLLSKTLESVWNAEVGQKTELSLVNWEINEEEEKTMKEDFLF